MRDRDFEFWLERIYKTAQGRTMERAVRQSRISNLRHVEEYEGDLDAHYARDQMVGLLRRFEYGRDEESRNVSPGHRIPIDGDRYTGTATLKSAINLYLKFSRAWPKGRAAPGV